jgi:hypothetical protein
MNEAWFNDVDVGLLGVRVAKVENARTLTRREWAIRPLPGVGQAVLTDQPTPGARLFVLKCNQTAASLAALEELRRQLVWYIKRRDTVVKLADRAGAFQRCRVVGADIPPIGPWARDINPAHDVEIELMAEDPAWYSNTETVVNFSAAQTACPIGNAVSWPRIVVTGPIVNPVVTLRAADGSVRRTMTLNITLTAGQTLTVDNEAGTVVDHTGASRMEVPGNGLWMIGLDPADAGGPNGPWPTLALTPAPSGGAGAVATYRIANE